MLIACCIADILRIFAPDAPYKEPAQIKTIFLFIIRQLGGLKDPKVPSLLYGTDLNPYNFSGSGAVKKDPDPYAIQNIAIATTSKNQKSFEKGITGTNYR